MSLRDITQAAIDKNPLALKTAVEAELGQRVHDAIQAKMSNSFAEQEEVDEDADQEEFDEDALNEGSYDRAAYGKGDAYDRSEAHEEAARDHEMAAEKHEKARNFTKADLHTAAAKAHQKAADNFSRIHAKRERSGGGGVLNTTKSRDAHAASLKAHSYNESIKLGEEMDEGACVREMKKLYAAACPKMEMYKKCNEKYGCSKSKFEALYAQYCKG